METDSSPQIHRMLVKLALGVARRSIENRIYIRLRWRVDAICLHKVVIILCAIFTRRRRFRIGRVKFRIQVTVRPRMVTMPQQVVCCGPPQPVRAFTSIPAVSTVDSKHDICMRRRRIRYTFPRRRHRSAFQWVAQTYFNTCVPSIVYYSTHTRIIHTTHGIYDLRYAYI